MCLYIWLGCVPTTHNNQSFGTYFNRRVHTQREIIIYSFLLYCCLSLELLLLTNFKTNIIIAPSVRLPQFNKHSASAPHTHTLTHTHEQTHTHILNSISHEIFLRKHPDCAHKSGKSTKRKLFT